MSRKPKILFSARDPGAVGHVVALLEAFSQDGRFDVDLAASGTALNLLKQAGKLPYAFRLVDGRDHVQDNDDPTHLLEATARLLVKSQPDAVFVSLSSFGIGIDEALLATAQVPTFAMQDFWGDVNLGLGVPAELYFVLDEYAVRLSQERWGVNAIAVGSPKHARYADFDVVALRDATRRSLGVGNEEKIVGFFGQSPMIPGHELAFQDLVKATAALNPRPLFLLREHPKFLAEFYDLHKRHLWEAKKLGLKVVDATAEPNPEAWLASCDVVVTPFSLCGLDHAYLSAYSQKPIGSVLYLLTNHALRAFAEQVCGMKQFPIVEQGVGTAVEMPNKLSTSVENALRRESAFAYFEASKSLQKGNPIKKIVAVVEQTLVVQ
ncbi:MAG: hypothetical protein ACPGWR_00305 [Ardenticatenaceae bacterium]